MCGNPQIKHHKNWKSEVLNGADMIVRDLSWSNHLFLLND